MQTIHEEKFPLHAAASGIPTRIGIQKSRMFFTPQITLREDHTYEQQNSVILEEEFKPGETVDFDKVTPKNSPEKTAEHLLRVSITPRQNIYAR